MKTSEMLTALGLAKSSLGPNDSQMQVLAHFCFMDDIIYAYNDITAVVVEAQTGLSCALHGETLMGILAVAGAEEVKIKLEGGGASIDVGNGWVKVPVLSAEDFLFQMPDEEPVVTLPFTDEVVKAFERCLMSVGADSLRPEFTGITVQVNKDGVVFYSSDNVSATRYKPEGKFVSRKTLSAVIPGIACEQMLKLRSDGAKISLGERVGTLEVGTVTLVTKLLPAKAEQFESIFKKHVEPSTFCPLPVELGREIAKAVVLLGREQVKKCVLTFAKGKAAVSASGILGSMNTTVVMPKDLNGFVSMSPELIARILPHADTIAVNDQASLVFEKGGMTHIIAAAAGIKADQIPKEETDDIPY